MHNFAVDKFRLESISKRSEMSEARQLPGSHHGKRRVTVRRADRRNVQYIYVIILAHAKGRRKRDKVLGGNASFLKQLSRCCLPWRLVSAAVAAKTLPNVFSAGAGKPAVLVDNEETGTGVRAGCNPRADCPGADSKGGSRGVMCSTVAHHPCRKYVAIVSSFGGSACLAEIASGWSDVRCECGQRAHETRMTVAASATGVSPLLGGAVDTLRGSKSRRTPSRMR